mgnify:CR=1 FL=1
MSFSRLKQFKNRRMILESIVVTSLRFNTMSFMGEDWKREEKKGVNVIRLPRLSAPERIISLNSSCAIF